MKRTTLAKSDNRALEEDITKSFVEQLMPVVIFFDEKKEKKLLL